MVDASAGDGETASAAGLDGFADALVVGDLDAAALVVADGHSPSAPSTDDQALEEGGAFAGGSGGAVGAVGLSEPQPPGSEIDKCAAWIAARLADRSVVDIDAGLHRHYDTDTDGQVVTIQTITGQTGSQLHASRHHGGNLISELLDC